MYHKLRPWQSLWSPAAVILVLLTLFAVASVTSGCAVPETYRADLTSAEILESVLSAIPDDGGYRPAARGYICTSTWGDDCEDLLEESEDYCIMLSENGDTNINELGVFRIREQEDVREAAAVVRDFVQGQQERYAGLLAAYNPAELPKLEQADVRIYGRYIFYSILSPEATAAARDAFERQLTK